MMESIGLAATTNCVESPDSGKNPFGSVGRFLRSSFRLRKGGSRSPTGNEYPEQTPPHVETPALLAAPTIGEADISSTSKKSPSPSIIRRALFSKSPHNSSSKGKHAMTYSEHTLLIILVDRSWSSRCMGSAEAVATGLNQLLDSSKRHDAAHGSKTHVIISVFDDAVRVIRDGSLSECNIIQDDEVLPSSCSAFNQALHKTVNSALATAYQMPTQSTHCQFVMFANGHDNASSVTSFAVTRDFYRLDEQFHGKLRLISASTSLSQMRNIVPKHIKIEMFQIATHRCGFESALCRIIKLLHSGCNRACTKPSSSAACELQGWDISVPESHVHKIETRACLKKRSKFWPFRRSWKSSPKKLTVLPQIVDVDSDTSLSKEQTLEL